MTWPTNPVLFNQEVVDTAGAFNPGVPGRIVTPAGKTLVRLEASFTVPDSGTSGGMFLKFYRNGVEMIGSWDQRRNASGSYANNVCRGLAPWQACTPGDYFEIGVGVNGLGNPTVISASVNTWFAASFE